MNGAEASSVVIVVPTYDEADNIVELLDRLGEVVPEARVLVIDDGSPDGTADVVEDYRARCPQRVRVVRRSAKEGLGAAYRAGFADALADGAEICVQMDADLSHDPRYLPALLSAVTTGADAALGSRYIPGGSIEDWPRLRRFLSRWGNRFAAGMLGLAINDGTSGYRAYRRSLLEAMDFGSVRAEGYGFQIEMTHRAVRRGARIIEVPIRFKDRIAGESKLTHHIIGEAFALVVRLWFRDRVLKKLAAVDMTSHHGDDREPRTILHVDMDAFFVSVELRRRPDLRGRPVVVGGSGSRGVVAAANYEARRFGVFSAMSSAKARRLCPDAIFLDGDHGLYSTVSAQVMAIFRDVTPHVEPLALDEAFLDVGGAVHLFGSGRDIGVLIRQRVLEELELPCSVGVASSKFIAKLASKSAKPVIRNGRVFPGEGVTVIEPGRELEFLHPLPIRALWGVGPATFAKLDRLGMRTVEDLVALDVATLERAIGQALGRHLHALARGIDERPVESERRIKSIGREETFANDVVDRQVLRADLVRLADDVASRLRGHGMAARTVVLKLRFGDFETITRSHTPATPVSSAPALVRVVEPLLDGVPIHRGVRLIGISVNGLVPPTGQLSLLADLEAEPITVEDVERAWAPASGAIDEIRHKFGASAIGPGSSMVAPRRSTPWGPRRSDQPSESPSESPNESRGPALP